MKRKYSQTMKIRNLIRIKEKGKRNSILSNFRVKEKEKSVFIRIQKLIHMTNSLVTISLCTITIQNEIFETQYITLGSNT